TDAAGNDSLASVSAGHLIDNLAPTVTATPSVTGGTGATSVDVDFAAVDNGSGVDNASGTYRVHTASLTNGVCGSFGAYGAISGGTLTGNATAATLAGFPLANNTCYQFQAT